MNTAVITICFIAIVAVVAIVYSAYIMKQYAIDPATREFASKKEIAENERRRKEQNVSQLIHDERYQIDASMRKIGEACPEFHQKYGKAMDILCHIQRMKMLVREYDNIPNKNMLIDYQNGFYLKVYDSIHQDLYSTTEPYLIGKKDIDKKYRGKIDLRIELSKFVAHLEKLKQLLNSSAQTP